MNYQYPDRISIEEEVEIEVSPLWAVLIIEIEGTSSFTGNEAFKKSREIASLIADLDNINYPTENIALENIMFQTSSGTFTKSSAAKFTIKLNKIALTIVPQVLGIIASQKNIRIQELAYDFGNLREQKNQLYIQACKAAKEQGQEICKTLSIPLLGVYTMTCNWHLPHIETSSQNYGTVGLMKSRSTARQEIEGLNFIAEQKDKLALILNVEFRVGEFK